MNSVKNPLSVMFLDSVLEKQLQLLNQTDYMNK